MFREVMQSSPVQAVLVLCASAMAWAQPVTPSPAPVLQRRCTNIVIISDTPFLPVGYISPYLQERARAQGAHLVVGTDKASADALIHLGPSKNMTTRITVANLISGAAASYIDGWTEYPGMVASDAMAALANVCPQVVDLHKPPTLRTGKCSRANTDLLQASGIAACSSTSWMGERALADALRSRLQSRRSSLRVSECGDGDVRLEVTHNLNQTVEWYWRLRKSKGEVFASGHVIAFLERDAAARIAVAVRNELAPVPPNEAPNSPDSIAHASRRTVRARLLPTDFSTLDTRVSLFIDDEGIVARTAGNKLLFEIDREQLRDVHLYTDWRPLMLPFDGPDVAFSYAGQMLDALRALDPTTGRPAISDETPRPRPWWWEQPCAGENGWWTGTLEAYGVDAPQPPRDYCPTFETAVFFTLWGDIVIKGSVSFLFEQVRVPSETLDIAWEEDDQIKTMSFVVPVFQASRIHHQLSQMVSGESAASCAENAKTPASAQ